MTKKLIVVKIKEDKSTIIVGNVYTSISTIDTSKQKIVKDIEDLVHTISQFHLVDVCAMLYRITELCNREFGLAQREVWPLPSAFGR